MRAVVKIQGRQYQVEEGRYLLVDRVNVDRLLGDNKGKTEDDTLEFGDVLLVSDGEQTLLGAPLVKGALVKARVLSHLRDKKILVYKMRPKKGYRLKKGHRQELTRLQIEFIDYPGRTAPQVKPVERTPLPEKAKPEPKVKAKKVSTPKAATVTETAAPEAPKAETQKAPEAKAKKSEGGEKKASAKKPAAKKPKTDQE